MAPVLMTTKELNGRQTRWAVKQKQSMLDFCLSFNIFQFDAVNAFTNSAMEETAFYMPWGLQRDNYIHETYLYWFLMNYLIPIKDQLPKFF